MAGPSVASRADAATIPPRNSSIDSAISTISSKSIANKSSPDGSPGAVPDVASLIKTAGSAEAVIQYLLKEKQSQSQQNSQLWRLVDKQRAMILGLNKDLERALKDKERYRKKLKEVMAMADVPPIPTVPSVQLSGPVQQARTGSDVETKERVLEVPDSPMDSDSQRPSPIDVSMAPYPITPPADQPRRDAPPSKVGEMLDPAHAMPKPSEHALDQFDHEAQDREAEKARVHADEANDLPINLSLPPSRNLPGPPRGPPPAIPPAIPSAPPASDGTPKADNGIAQFPAPPAPPPRKLPPAPLQLNNAKQNPTIPPEEDYETDSDYDDILEVDEIAANEIPTNDRRGRRRTREEDDRERELLARKEAEMRSLSKKSKGSSKGTPKIDQQEPPPPKEALPSPGLPTPQRAGMQRDNVPASLAGVLNGDAGQDLRAPVVPPALLSPGLPSSPRPMGMKSPMNSPPLSPLGVTSFGGMPLSPRPPRQPIPLPPNTPLHTPPNMEPLNLKSPKPLNIIKKVDETSEPSPTKNSSHASDSPNTVERTRIYKGFVTEEFPELLLPPNALPSVDIRVASSRMKPSRASLVSVTQLEEDPVFTLAVFSRADGGELWRVEKDSASLAKLDHRLKQCPAFTARTPDRSLFSGHAPAKLDARRIALDQYLDELLNTPLDLATALELCKYLSTNTLPPNADETGSSPADPNIEGSQKLGPGGRPYKNGYLTKRGKNFGGWKARYFVLDGPHLKYYETPGGAHLGTIKLQRAQIGKQQGHSEGQSPARAPTGNEDIDNQYRHAFLILEPKKKDPNSVTKHVLCAESDRERDQWVETLLRWIDYKDPNDEEPAKKDHAHDRHVSATQAAHAKRKTQGTKQAPQQPTDSQDTLIGVSYEATRAGEAPDGAPSKSKNSGGHEQDSQHGKTMSSQPGFSISAPTDMQVITDSQPWGSKLGMALAPPNQEEKKARKRSFFGFGPKTRTSSDGQDSLFGSDSASISSQQTGNQSSGPVRQVFGASLAEAVRYNSPVDVKVPLPAVVYRCIQYLEARNAILEEGIFRLSGSNVVIKALRERFNAESDINLLEDEQYHDIHAVASLLKLYLRELPTTILTRDLHLQFLSVTEMPVHAEKIAALSELVLRLPQANATLLKYLIAFLIKIINHQDSNKMTVRNVGIVFSPTLNIPAPVFAMFLQNYEGIFGIDPTEYELPTPIDQDSRLPSERLSDRPSFQQDRSSPHRQRLMDSLMEKPGSRNTPTPPPVNLQHMAQMNAAQRSSPAQQRSSPTPPPQRSYEPQFLAQQNVVDNRVSTRPAYESGFVLPQGYDVTQYQPPPSRGNAASYDRPSFEAPGGGLAPYEQSYGGPSGSRSRRESAIFMSGTGGGLRSEGSRSRLREEAQF
ncbi:RhoGAP-domain-containing protein [Coniochaeta hoffmannii]|uniref:RhoGAP-domain-containing protein n=1 Tax=Coniochaeta hoffmannii TaxID=91930 RepID=A0AA38RPD9_9PEZI|nr:RhoGAP-domain-containing protein [Coniochaeta hoffmannii]